MKDEGYSMSFSTGGLFRLESVELALIFLEINDWTAVQIKVLADNLLQARTINTSKRFCREIISRLKTLTRSEVELLVHGNIQEQSYLLWLAICRRYKFIADFAVEIIRERFINLKADLHNEDFNSFFDRKSEWHPEIDKLRPSTRNKLRQVLFKILREADLLSDNNIINAAILSPRFMEVISLRQDVLFFPTFDSGLRGVLQ